MKNAFVFKLTVFVFTAFFIFTIKAESKPSNIVFRSETSLKNREHLTEKLRTITGWNNLKFDTDGFLQLSENGKFSNGSATARAFLTRALADKHLMVIEDVSNRKDVIFCQVVQGRWTKGANDKPPVYVIQIDFADFEQVIGDKKVLASFNEGWGFLHEVSHVVNNSVDTTHTDEIGECETFINTMRRECGLAERAEYFHTLSPLTIANPFSTKLVRLGFDLTQENSGKKKRYWLVWDANIVGGLENTGNVASR